MITMRKFDNLDWDCWSGCESEKPIIGFMVVVNNAFGNDMEAEVIVDDKIIHIYTIDNINFRRTFETELEAVMWTKINDPKITARDLINDGFECDNNIYY